MADCTMQVVCGIEASSDQAVFSLQSNESYEGPALQLDQGFVFITRHWPLLIMHNIEAGSVGTTAVARQVGDEVQLYLLRNGSGEVGTELQSDCGSCMHVEAHGRDPDHLDKYLGPTETDVVMCKFSQVAGTEDYEPQLDGNNHRKLWYFDVSTTGDDVFEVALDSSMSSPGDDAGARAFLEEVLAKARDYNLYQLPAKCDWQP